MDFSKHIGKTVKARNGMPVDIIAYVPEAGERYRLVVMGHDKRVRTCTIDGRFALHGRQTHLDLMPPTTKIRMRAYRHPNGTVQGVVVDQDEFLLTLGGGHWNPCSEPFDVEIEA